MAFSSKGAEGAACQLKGSDFSTQSDSQGGEMPRTRGPRAHPAKAIGHSTRRNGGQGLPVGGLVGKTFHQTIHLGLQRSGSNGKTDVTALEQGHCHKKTRPSVCAKERVNSVLGLRA